MGLSPDLRWQASAPARAGDPYLDWSLATAWVGQPPSRQPLWVPLLAPRGAAWDAVLAELGAQGLARPSPWNPADTPWGVLWVRADAVAGARGWSGGACGGARAMLTGLDPHPAPTPLNNSVSISGTRLP